MAWGRQTGKTNRALALWKYERYSFMQVMEPIYPIYPDPIPKFPKFVYDGVRVIEHIDIVAERTPINVGTIGHVDWPTIDLVKHKDW